MPFLIPRNVVSLHHTETTDDTVYGELAKRSGVEDEWRNSRQRSRYGRTRQGSRRGGGSGRSSRCGWRRGRLASRWRRSRRGGGRILRSTTRGQPKAKNNDGKALPKNFIPLLRWQVAENKCALGSLLAPKSRPNVVIGPTFFIDSFVLFSPIRNRSHSHLEISRSCVCCVMSLAGAWTKGQSNSISEDDKR